MTNAEKYRLTGIEAYNLSQELGEYLTIEKKAEGVFVSDINSFFVKATKPTLTEDERVILRNLQNVRYIGRTSGTGYLYATFNTIDNYSNRSDITDIDLYFSNLFQFIKAGEEYKIEELIKR